MFYLNSNERVDYWIKAYLIGYFEFWHKWDDQCHNALKGDHLV